MRTITFLLLGWLFAGVAPAAAQAWLMIAGGDGSFRFEMPVPFELLQSDTELDGTTTVSYRHTTPDLSLRLDVVDTEACHCKLAVGPDIVAERKEAGARVEVTWSYVVGLRTYRLTATSTLETEADPMIHRFLGSMRLAR